MGNFTLLKQEFNHGHHFTIFSDVKLKYIYPGHFRVCSVSPPMPQTRRHSTDNFPVIIGNIKNIFSRNSPKYPRLAPAPRRGSEVTNFLIA